MIAAAATLGAGAISSAGQYYTNQKNLDYTKWKNNVDYAIAERNNATQVNLANSAHQREVQDLRAAGLNPILSAGGSGAATPQLRSAEMGTFQADNPVSSLGMSAKEAAAMHSAQVRAQVANMQAQNDNLISQNGLIDAQAKEALWNAEHPTEISRKVAEIEDGIRLAEKHIPGFYADAKELGERLRSELASLIPQLSFDLPKQKASDGGSNSARTGKDSFDSYKAYESYMKSVFGDDWKPDTVPRKKEFYQDYYKPFSRAFGQPIRHSAIFTR